MISAGVVAVPVGLVGAALLIIGAALTAPVSWRLARASWTGRGPRPALVLWQAVCLAAGLSVVAGLALLAVAPLGDSILSAAWKAFGALLTGDLRLPVWRLLCAGLAVALTALLLAVLARTALLTARRRYAHRRMLDLLTQPAAPVMQRRPASATHHVRILDHRTPLAYTLPGWHSRVVLTAGLLDLLTPAELEAVVEHERAHLRARHDVLVLPFQAWAVALGWIPGVHRAGRSVAELTEMLADDIAAARTSRVTLATALAKVALSGDPAAAGLSYLPAGPGSPSARPRIDSTHSPAVGGTAVTDRVTRLLNPDPLRRWQVAMVGVMTALLLAIPAGVLLFSWS